MSAWAEKPTAVGGGNKDIIAAVEKAKEIAATNAEFAKIVERLESEPSAVERVAQQLLVEAGQRGR